jgi:hypothetical protein
VAAKVRVFVAEGCGDGGRLVGEAATIVARGETELVASAGGRDVGLPDGFDVQAPIDIANASVKNITMQIWAERKSNTFGHKIRVEGMNSTPIPLQWHDFPSDTRLPSLT